MAENSPRYSAGTFPRLTGEYGVGICDVLPSLNGEEPLLIRLFYPTMKKPHEVQQSELYLPEPSSLYRYTKSFMLAYGAMPSFLAAPMAYVASYLSNFRLPAILHAPLLEGKQFPVIVFSHGLMGYRGGSSTTFLSDLASHGYIVAAVEHKDGSACLSYTKTKTENTQGGEPVWEDKWIEYVKTDIHALPLRYDQVKQRASELSLALDFLTTLNKGDNFRDLWSIEYDFSPFKGRIDLDHVVAMGLSFGGPTTIVALANDLRFRCGVALDSWMFPVYDEVYDLVKTPLVFINAPNFQWARNVKCMMKLVKESEERGNSFSQIFTVRGSTHLSLTDLPFMMPSYIMKKMGYYSPDGDIYEVFDASLQLMYAFLNRHLWKDPSPQPILDGGEGQHRLVMSGTNLDLSGPDEGWIDPLTRYN